jgi:hypothetical protein
MEAKGRELVDVMDCEAPSPNDPYATNMNNCLVARKKAIYWGIAMGPSGPIGYRGAVFMKAARHREKFSLPDFLPVIFINLRSC